MMVCGGVGMGVRFKVVALTLLMVVLFSAFAMFVVAEPGITINVETDQAGYYPGDRVTVSGQVLKDGEPVVGEYVTYWVVDADGNTMVINTVSTDSQGRFSDSFRIDPNAPYGVYTVKVAYGGVLNSTTFNVIKAVTTTTTETQTTTVTTTTTTGTVTETTTATTTITTTTVITETTVTTTVSTVTETQTKTTVITTTIPVTKVTTTTETRIRTTPTTITIATPVPMTTTSYVTLTDTVIKPVTVTQYKPVTFTTVYPVTETKLKTLTKTLTTSRTVVTAVPTTITVTEWGPPIATAIVIVVVGFTLIYMLLVRKGKLGEKTTS